MKNTAHEVLIAEMLGDVLKLHDKIQTLPEAFKEAIAPSLGSIALAIEDAKASIQHTKEAEIADLKRSSAYQMNTLIVSLKTAIHEEAGKALSTAARTLATSNQFHEYAIQEEKKKQKMWVLIAISGSLLSGVLSTLITHFFWA